MRAIVQERYGSPDDLAFREVEKPVVRDDDVLVRVRAASVHPDVWHVVSGRPCLLRLMGAGFFRPKNPIPGTDMAGIVESVGKAGKITPIIDSTYPLSETREALRHMIEDEIQGKVIITVQKKS